MVRCNVIYLDFNNQNYFLFYLGEIDMKLDLEDIGMCLNKSLDKNIHMVEKTTQTETFHVSGNLDYPFTIHPVSWIFFSIFVIIVGYEWYSEWHSSLQSSHHVMSSKNTGATPPTMICLTLFLSRKFLICQKATHLQCHHKSSLILLNTNIAPHTIWLRVSSHNHKP